MDHKRIYAPAETPEEFYGHAEGPNCEWCLEAAANSSGLCDACWEQREGMIQEEAEAHA